MPKMNPHRTNCGARSKRTGEPCQKSAGWGTKHPGYGVCRLHGGMTDNHRKHAGKLEAADLPMVMGMPADTEPGDAVMRGIAVANGKVNASTRWIIELSTPEALADPVPGKTLQRVLDDRDRDLDTLVRYAKIAHDMGISERQINLAERMGDLLGDLVAGVLGDLGLTAEQQARAPVIVRRHLELVAGRVA